MRNYAEIASGELAAKKRSVSDGASDAGWGSVSAVCRPPTLLLLLLLLLLRLLGRIGRFVLMRAIIKPTVQITATLHS